jgi:hypothetical protein
LASSNGTSYVAGLGGAAVARRLGPRPMAAGARWGTVGATGRRTRTEELA